MLKMDPTRLFVILVTLASIQTACSHNKLSPSERASFHTLKIHPQITIPKRFEVDGFVLDDEAFYGWHRIPGLIWLANSIRQDELEDELAAMMEENDLRLGHLLFDELRRAVAETEFELVSSEAPADARFVIELRYARLTGSESLASNRAYDGTHRPAMTLQLSLVRGKSQTLWSQRKVLNSDNNRALAAYAIPDMLAEPKIFEASMRAAVASIFTTMLDDLEGDPDPGGPP